MCLKPTKKIYILVATFLLIVFFSICSFYVSLVKMRLRTRKGSPRSSHGPAGRTARTKRKHSEEEEEEESSPLAEKLPKSDTGLLSTIKNFIKGSTTKVSISCNTTGLTIQCVAASVVPPDV